MAILKPAPSSVKSDRADSRCAASAVSAAALGYSR